MFKIPSVKPIKTWKTESEKDKGVFYTIELWESNRITCSCPALKECKHIKKFKKIREYEKYHKVNG